MLVFGRRHLVRLPALSVRYHPSRFTALLPEFRSSIQSPYWLSSSFSPLPLEAMNSEMVTCSAAWMIHAPPKSAAAPKDRIELRISCLGLRKP